MRRQHLNMQRERSLESPKSDTHGWVNWGIDKIFLLKVVMQGLWTCAG